MRDWEKFEYLRVMMLNFQFFRLLSLSKWLPTFGSIGVPSSGSNGRRKWSQIPHLRWRAEFNDRVYNCPPLVTNLINNSDTSLDVFWIGSTFIHINFPKFAIFNTYVFKSKWRNESRSRSYNSDDSSPSSLNYYWSSSMRERTVCIYSYILIVACSFLVLVTKGRFFNNEVEI
jgi:hypothetical protein